MTRDDIEQLNVLSACDLLRRLPGINILDDGPNSCKPVLRGATAGSSRENRVIAPQLCEPTVYEDNIAFTGTFSEFARSVPPRDIMGIEVYTSATEPPQFPGACGAIVVWTRAGLQP
jgi:hypothetical protein